MHKIGVDQVTLGMDYPHPEGTWGMGLNDAGHIEYLNATVGAAKVPAEDARKILGEKAVRLWGFDRAKLQPVVEAHGKTMTEILKVPDVDNFPRGDVGKPSATPGDGHTWLFRGAGEDVIQTRAGTPAISAHTLGWQRCSRETKAPLGSMISWEPLAPVGASRQREETNTRKRAK